MKIGIDIDNVIADFARAFLPRLAKHCKCSFEDVVSYDFHKNFDISDRKFKRLWNKIEKDKIYNELALIKGAHNALSKLSKKNKIILITSRKKRFYRQTLKWLKKHKLPFAKLEVVGSTKEKIDKMSRCELVLEDDLEVARMIESKGVQVVLFNYPWNKIGRKIKRVNNWQQAIKFIMTNAT